MVSIPINIGLPAKMHFFDNASHIEIVRTWFSFHVVLLSAIAIVCDGYLLNGFGVVPFSAQPLDTLFQLLYISLALAITYYAVAGWFNKTSVIADQNKIGVRHGPFPWVGNKSIKGSDVKQLYAKKISGLRQKDANAIYEVWANTISGQTIKISGGLDTEEQAFFIEQNIAKFYDIKDMPVKEEV